MFYLELGIRHILDVQGADHMIFLLALTLPLEFKLWKPTLQWITAFTVGHSVSLALAALGWVKFPGEYIELGIALTIFGTALWHVFSGFKVQRAGLWVAGIFGLVHGLGFGSYYSFIAQNDEFLWAWIPFNVGIELGQILVVLILLFVYWGFLKFGGRQKAYRWVLAGVVLALSFQMIMDRFPNELI